MNKGYNINMRTFKYWYVNDEEILNILDKSDKKIYTKEDMVENKININRIINEVINKYIDDEVMNNGNNMDVDINPNINLGIEVPN
jgi:hypothetical protein